MRRSDRKKVAELLKGLVRIRSDGRETSIVPFLKKALRENGWDCVKTAEGSVWGRIGSGKKILLYDIHSDTVKADERMWKNPPFGATVKGGFLYGRGAVDDKGPLASAIFSGNFIRKRRGISVYLLAAAAEERAEGFGFRTFLKYEKKKPDFALISEPSSLNLAVGQRGRFELTVSLPGIPAHGSMPERGKNAIYAAAEFLEKVKKIKFAANPPFPPVSVAPTIVKTSGDGRNVLPNSCEILFDVRISHKDNPEALKRKIMKFAPLTSSSKIAKFCSAWLLSAKDPFRGMCEEAYLKVFGRRPKPYHWKFCTNASEYVRHGIPVAGFGPGAPEEAHKKDEKISLKEVEKAVGFFAALPECVAGDRGKANDR